MTAEVLPEMDGPEQTSIQDGQSDAEQPGNEESVSEESDVDEIPFRTNNQAGSESDSTSHEEGSSDSDPSEIDYESAPDDFGEQSDSETSETVSSDLPACIACNKTHTKCDKSNPCQMCLQEGRQCTYSNYTAIKKDVARERVGDLDSTSSEERYTLTHEGLTPNPRKHALDQDPTISNNQSNFQPTFHWMFNCNLVQKLSNLAALNSGRQGNDAFWVNSDGERVDVSRCQVRAELVTVAQCQGHPPSLLAIAWKTRQATYSCTAYTAWRGLAGFDSKPSVYKIFPTRNVPVAELLRDIKNYQLSKRPDRALMDRTETPPKRQRLNDTGVTLPASSAPTDLRITVLPQLPTTLPEHLRFLLKEYIQKHPREKTLDCASVSSNKRLTQTHSGQPATWVSETGEHLDVDQCDLGAYGWILIAQSSVFSARIIKYWPCQGYSSSAGRSSFFIWRGLRGWDDRPKVFKTWQSVQVEQTDDDDSGVGLTDDSVDSTSPMTTGAEPNPHPLTSAERAKRTVSTKPKDGGTLSIESASSTDISQPKEISRLPNTGGQPLRKTRSSLIAHTSTTSPSTNSAKPIHKLTRSRSISPLIRSQPDSFKERQDTRQKTPQVIIPPREPAHPPRIPPMPQQHTSNRPKDTQRPSPEETPQQARHDSLQPLSQPPIPPETHLPTVNFHHLPKITSTTSPTTAATTIATSSTDTTLLYFAGTRPRTRPFLPACSTIQKLFLQATAAGMFETLADASMLLCRLPAPAGSGNPEREVAVIRDAEEDFEELRAAIEEVGLRRGSGGVREVRVEDLKLE